MPGGALLVDGPGLRELQLWADSGGADSTFADVESLARTCRFRDCVHVTEPGCAVQAAIESGELSPERYASWQKLQREILAFAARHDHRVRLEQKRRWKVIGKALRARPNKKT
jgi:ribosome biogenesis GTPase